MCWICIPNPMTLNVPWFVLMNLRSQLISETRTPLPRTSNHPKRYDYEYKREGTCNLFMFFAPLEGWRHVKVTSRRTTKDFAICMKELVDIHFPKAQVIQVVLDNLNTHTPWALYETFPP
jgi:hypothetical protein